MNNHPAITGNGSEGRPRLDLSGPLLSSAFEALLSGTESQGGVEVWIDALKLKSQMFQQALAGESTDGPSQDAFKGLCAFMSSVRRRVGPWLEKPDFEHMSLAIVELLDGMNDTSTCDERLAAFCGKFPQDRKHRWVRDLGTEILHGMDPERYPIMNRWIWDSGANTGVIREVWYGDEVDTMTIPVPDGFETCLMLRQEFSQFLAGNGVFRDMIWYVDLLCAQIYAGYICSQGGVYLRADFSSPHDPMEHTRRLLGLDGVRAGSGRTRLKAIDGEAHVLEESSVSALAAQHDGA
jgi:hypothetical protein